MHFLPGKYMLKVLQMSVKIHLLPDMNQKPGEDGPRRLDTDLLQQVTIQHQLGKTLLPPVLTHFLLVTGLRQLTMMPMRLEQVPSHQVLEAFHSVQ
jgi:hypothetical protein